MFQSTRDVFFSVIFVLAIVPLIGTAGPRVETWFLPIITDLEETVSFSGIVIEVQTSFVKRRACPVAYAAHDYRLDVGFSVPTASPEGFNRSNGGETHLSRQYVVPLGKLRDGVLRRTLFYRCHGFWLTPVKLPDLRLDARERGLNGALTG